MNNDRLQRLIDFGFMCVEFVGENEVKWLEATAFSFLPRISLRNSTNLHFRL
jgi:hypothetical protein